MKKSNINTWEEIIFERRNKDYGAYLLRYNYSRRLTASALAVITIFLLCLLVVNIFSDNKKKDHKTREILIINYNELTEPPSIERSYVPLKQVAVKQPEAEKHVKPEVVKEEIAEPEITEEEDEIKEVVNPVESYEYTEDTENPEGIETDGPVEPVFDINPQFPGGSGSFYYWIEQNLRYPAAAKRMGIEGKVIVGFMIDENGRIYDVTILKSLHRLCDLEAMRLVRIMPLWVPGIKQGMKIRGRHSVEIPFIIK